MSEGANEETRGDTEGRSENSLMMITPAAIDVDNEKLMNDYIMVQKEQESAALAMDRCCRGTRQRVQTCAARLRSFYSLLPAAAASSRCARVAVSVV